MKFEIILTTARFAFVCFACFNAMMSIAAEGDANKAAVRANCMFAGIPIYVPANEAVLKPDEDASLSTPSNSVACYCSTESSVSPFLCEITRYYTRESRRQYRLLIKKRFNLNDDKATKGFIDDILDYINGRKIEDISKSQTAGHVDADLSGSPAWEWRYVAWDMKMWVWKDDKAQYVSLSAVDPRLIKCVDR